MHFLEWQRLDFKQKVFKMPLLDQCWPKYLPTYGVTAPQWVIGIDTNIEIVVFSLTTWEAHHSPRAKPYCFGELPRWLMRPQWRKMSYEFLFYYYDETKSMMNKQMLSRQMLKIAPKLSWIQHGFMCTSQGQMTQCFFFRNACSNHYHITVYFVTLNSSHIFHQNK